MTTNHLRPCRMHARHGRASAALFALGATVLASGCNNTIGVPLFTDAAPDGAPLADAASVAAIDVQAGEPADAQDEFRSTIRVYGAPPH
jgi:hypothetical protein